MVLGVVGNWDPQKFRPRDHLNSAAELINKLDK